MLSKKGGRLAKYLLKSNNINKIINKLDLANEDHKSALIEVIERFAELILETDNILNRRTGDWVSQNITDLEAVLEFLTKRPEYSNDRVVKNIEGQLTDIKKLISSIKVLKNET